MYFPLKYINQCLCTSCLFSIPPPTNTHLLIISSAERMASYTQALCKCRACILPGLVFILRIYLYNHLLCSIQWHLLNRSSFHMSCLVNLTIKGENGGVLDGVLARKRKTWILLCWSALPQLPGSPHNRFSRELSIQEHNRNQRTTDLLNVETPMPSQPCGKFTLK